MRKLRCSRKRTNTEKIKYSFFVFDVETTCLEPMSKNFVFGCIYGYNYKKTIYTVEEFKNEFKKSKYKKKYIFAHNAEFDLLTIFGNIFTKVDNAAIFNGKFICAKRDDVTFADSMNVYPTSVAKLGELIELPKLENKKVLSSRLTVKNITEEDIEYCMRDCEIVFKALLKIFEFVGDIKITLPSLAMYDFRHNYIEDDLHFSDLVDEFYESYYGGRTEAFFIGRCQAKAYDINSMYAKAMSQVILPDVKRLHKTEAADTKFLQFCLEHYEGMCKVTVVHAPSHFGYLPYRAKLNGTTKLIFPVGEFTTTVNFNELRFAIEAGVVTVKKVHKVVYGNPIKSIFYEYINDNWEKRKAAKNVLESTIYKLKMNALYGRFAMRLKLVTQYYEIIPYNLITTLKQAAKYCDIKLFNNIRPDCFLVTEDAHPKDSWYSIPAFSSYITSEARVILLKSLIANEKNGVLYCDTDSIFLTGDFSGNVSDNLGDFKQEPKIINEINGLKNYKYIDSDGKENIVIKGISRGSIAKGTTATVFESERYYKSKASLRNQKEAGQRYTLVKHITNNYDKREVLSTGQTCALICKNDILINATTFLRVANKSINKRKKRFRYEPQNMREAIMMFFINGGKVYTKDLRDHVTGSSNAELKNYFGLYAKDGVHMDVFCEYVPDEFYTDQPINEFQDVLLSYNTVTKMREALEANATILENIKQEKIEYELEYDTPF